MDTLHRCTERKCPFVGQVTSKSCRCHKTAEQMLARRVAELEIALGALCDDIEKHHARDDCDTCRLVDAGRAVLPSPGGW